MLSMLQYLFMDIEFGDFCWHSFVSDELGLRVLEACIREGPSAMMTLDLSSVNYFEENDNFSC